MNVHEEMKEEKKHQVPLVTKKLKSFTIFNKFLQNN